VKILHQMVPFYNKGKAMKTCPSCGSTEISVEDEYCRRILVQEEGHWVLDPAYMSPSGVLTFVCEGGCGKKWTELGFITDLL